MNRVETETEICRLAQYFADLIKQRDAVPQTAPQIATAIREAYDQNNLSFSDWSECPFLPHEKWNEEAGENNTLQGYWDWVYSQIEAGELYDSEGDMVADAGWLSDTIAEIIENELELREKALSQKLEDTGALETVSHEVFSTLKECQGLLEKQLSEDLEYSDRSIYRDTLDRINSVLIKHQGIKNNADPASPAMPSAQHREP